MGRWMRLVAAVGVLSVVVGCSSAKLPSVRRDGGAGADLGELVDVKVTDGSIVDDDGLLIDGGGPFVDRQPPADVRDAGGDAGDAGPAPDAGVRMTFTFVSAALNSPPGSPVQMRAQIVWHGALRGESADGRIRFEGVIQ